MSNSDKIIRLKTVLGRTKLYELIGSGEIEVVKLGKSTRITTASLHELVMRQREPK